MKKLGVIGGLGPMATAFFMQMVIEMTDAEIDQNHIEMLIHNCPSIPDRTNYILGKSNDNPGPRMIEVGKVLADAGSQVIAIPCVTANYFYDELTEKIPAEVINTIKETADYLREKGINKVGLMATDGTVQSGLFNAEFEKSGIELIVPGERAQKYVMDIIYNNVKAGKVIDMDEFEFVSVELRGKGAQVILLGCTELSMARRDENIGPGYLDVMQVLARTSVIKCGLLKEEYTDIITK